MQILATYNIKGGVGKTASTINLAYLSAREGARTLIWDLDPQGATTFYLRVTPRIKGGERKLLSKKQSLDDFIKATEYRRLHLLPADISYRNLDISLSQHKRPTRQFLKALQPLAAEYDRIFLDCPPGISLVSENILTAADAVLVPLIPTTLSLRSMEQVADFSALNDVGELELLFFFTMVDRRKRLHRDTMAELSAKTDHVLHTAIPYASDVERMGVHRAPLAVFAAGRPATLAYEELWAEIKARVG